MSVRYEFYSLAEVIGLIQGGIQALSRSYYAKMILIDRTGEYFGFYNMVGKFAAIFGPAHVGGVTLLARSLGCVSTLAARVSIASILLFFVAGGAIFYLTGETQGKKMTDSSHNPTIG